MERRRRAGIWRTLRRRCGLRRHPRRSPPRPGAIAHGHQAIFDSIYRGSQQTYDLLQARALTDDVVLAIAQGNLNAPGGPMAGESQSTATLVLVRDGEDWQIASFHNTLVAPTR